MINFKKEFSNTIFYFSFQIFLFVLILTTTVKWGFAVTITSNVVADSFITESTPNTPNGDNALLMIGRNVDSSSFHSFIKFEFPSIPSNATIISASLKIYRVTHTGGLDIGVYRVTSLWTEDKITWNNKPSISPKEWATFYTGTSGYTKTVNLTDLVKYEFENDYYHYGYLLLSATASSGNYVSIASKEGAQQPVLKVTYSLPDTDDNYEGNNGNNTLDTAYNLSNYENTLLSDIDGYGIQADEDWYKIYVSPGNRRVLIDCRFTQSEGDIDIELFDGSGSYLKNSNSGTDNEYIDYVVPTSGYHYIRVYVGDEGNTYDLKWNDIQVPCADADGDGYTDESCGGDDCNDSNSSVHPGTAEVCNGEDDNCNGIADENLGTTTCGLGVCEHIIINCVGGIPQTCDPFEGSSFETCDGVDNNCNGQVDENLGTITCGEGACQRTVDACVNGVDNNCDGFTDEGCNPPVFEMSINLDVTDNEPIKVCFTPDQSLNADPDITLVSENGNEVNRLLSSFKPCSGVYCVDYNESDSISEVEIRIDENDPIVPGSPGFAVANFTIDDEHKYSSSFCILPEGDEECLIVDPCDSDNVTCEVAFDDWVLNGNVNHDCNLVRIIEYDDVPAKVIDQIPNRMVSSVVDIGLPDGVGIDSGTVTVTLNFTLPADWSQQEFRDNLQVYYYNETNNKWESVAQASDGSATIEWDTPPTTGTITFETDHLSTFAASSKQNQPPPDDDDDDGGGTQAASGGGCSVTPGIHSMSMNSTIADALVFFLPLIVFGIRRRGARTKRPSGGSPVL